MARGCVAAALLALLPWAARSFCPQGFGDFPKEYKIPAWPKDMTIEESAKLYTVSLEGFKYDKLNEEYLQGPTQEFQMQGHDTYWQASGQFFMYYCQRFRKWRIAEISAFSKNMDNQCFAFVSDAHPARDILNRTLLKGFIEVEDGKWVSREHAGVAAIGTLGEQMDTAGEEEEEAEEVPGCETAGEGEESPIGGEDTSKCPVMPVVRKAKEKVMQAARTAGKWVRRLFPNYLGAPDEEDAIPEGEDGVYEADADGCRPDTLKGCNIKEQFYVEKQKNVTAEKRRSELQRLGKMKDVVMKPDQRDWLLSRISILSKMAAKDEL